MTEKDDNKGGYTSVILGDLLEKVDKQSADTGMDNRSLLIRLILQEYYKLKEKGVDLLKIDDVDEFVKKVKG